MDNNQGENNVPRPQDWEMLSLSMSMSSTSDPKPAPDPSVQPKEEELGVWDAPMNSKYFVTPFDKEPSTEKPQEPSYEPEGQIEGQASKDEALDRTDLNILESKVVMKEAEDEAAFVSPSEPFEREFQPTGIEEEKNLSIEEEKDVSNLNIPDAGDKNIVDKTIKKYDKLAWWKRQSSLIFSQLKEANTILSIAVAAAVVGLAIIGHRWHHERLQNQHLRLQVYSKEEKVNQLTYQLGKLRESVMGRRSVPVVRPSSAYVSQY